ncbi:MAG: sterol carrier family protein [Propioniciclava sp.]
MGPTGNAPLAGRVRTSLRDFARQHPGQLIEIRVPPYAAVQVGLPGVTTAHRRGTPPNVIEMTPEIWLALSNGSVSWTEATHAHLVQASGVHADLGPLLRAVGTSDVERSV